MKTLFFALCIALCAAFSHAQNLDMIVLFDGDSIACNVIGFDNNWTKVKIEDGDKTRARNVSTKKVRTITIAYGTDQEEVVLGEVAKSLVVVSGEQSSAAIQPLSPHLIESAEHLRTAGEHGLISMGTIVLGAATAVGLGLIDRPYGALAVYGVTTVVSLGFTVSAIGHLRSLAVRFTIM